MCLKSVAVTGTALLFNNTLSVLLELPFCPAVTIFLGNCTDKIPPALTTIQKRPLSLVVGLRGGSIQVIQMTVLVYFV